MRAAMLIALLGSACVVYDGSLLGAADGGAKDVAAPCSKCGGKCVDLTKDAKNCGSCGRDCAGVACEGGVCQPEVLASALAAPRGIHVDDARVYFANHGSISTQMMDKDGMNSVTFGGAQVFPDFIVEEQGSLFWINEVDSRGALLGMSKLVLPGNMPDRLLLDLPAPSGLAVIGANAYLTMGAPKNLSPGCAMDAYVGALVRCPITGCLPLQCGGAGPVILASGMTAPRGVSGDLAGVVWAESDKIWGCDVPNCKSRVALADGQDKPLSTAVDQDHVYWTTASALMSCERTSCASTKTALARDLVGPRRMALDGGTIYWTSADGAARRCALPNCPEIQTLAKNLASPWGIAVDATHVYVVAEGSRGTSSIDGQVIRLPK